MTIDQYLEIDGSFGEGGGSIIRIAAGYSLLYKRPIRIKNIRANRPKPGLRMQHLMGLKALTKLTNSELSNCEVGSKEIVLNPGQSVKNSIQVDINTAGNIGLLLQPIQIACLGLNSIDKIEISINGGGTFGKWAPALNYLADVTYKIFKNHGFRIDLDIQRHGFYPKGGALVKCTLYPPKSNVKPVYLTELGNIDLIQGKIISTSHLKQKKVSERIRESVQKQLNKELKIDVKIEYEYVNTLSPGVGLYLWANSENGAYISSGTILGDRNITSEHVGKLAANELIKYIRNEIPVDNYLSDQLIPFMGFVKESSRIKVLELTNHTRTNLELMELFLKRKYKIIKENNDWIIELQ